MNDRTWHGRTVRIVEVPGEVRLPIRISLRKGAAQSLALALHRLEQTTLGSPDVQELLHALDYVLVGDPASQAAHRRMEAGKGMDPATDTGEIPIRRRDQPLLQVDMGD
jgi:hypothetical protein